VTASPFGTSSAGLLQRLRPSRVDVADLRDVAEEVLPALTHPGVRLGLDSRPGAGSAVVVEEDERAVRAPLRELADDMTRAGVPATPEGIAGALAAWVDARPVTDAAAAAAGIAVLDWADDDRRSVAWRVVVCRGERAVSWTPSPAGRSALPSTRAAAATRAGEVVLDLRVEGPVALWSHGVVPVLATAALRAPERMLERMAAGGLELGDVHAVVTPHRPLACTGGGVAARLAGETSEASVTLPWPRLADLPWV
jgi:hypothetical protein